MEPELLQTLKEIRGVLYSMGVAVFIACLFWVIKLISQIIINIKKAMSEAWGNNATDYYDKGEIDKLKKHCEDRISEYPNDAYAFWWLARAYKNTGDVEKADSYFYKVNDIQPSWYEEYVKPYISSPIAEKNANK